MARKASSSTSSSTAHLGFEQKLWLAADKLRNNMDAAEPERSGDSQPKAARRASKARQYKHVVLGMIFLKYISDTFDEHHARLVAGEGDYAGANLEDQEEYLAAHVFWVPLEARWAQLQARAKLPSIGKDVDDAMVALERDNPRLKGALNKNYGRADLDKHRLGELIDLIGSIQLAEAGSRSKDLLGRVFEYFLTQFASAEGKNGGQFYTPSCVVRLLVEMLAPYKGRIYDPACGSGGSLPAQSRLRRIRFAQKHRAIAHGGEQSEKFVESHGGQLGDISIYGRDKSARRKRRFGLPRGARRASMRRRARQSNPTTRRLAIMNLALRGIEADFGPENADTFRRDFHPDLRADYALANPPFNDSDTALRGSALIRSKAKPQVVSEAKDNFRKDDDVRWQFGVPPRGNANFAWVQHFIHHLAPHGMAGFVLANGSMSSNHSGDCPRRAHSKTRSTNSQSLGRQRDIRRALIEADLVDCMVALPGQLFYSTQIPVCLWFLTKSKAADTKRGFRERRQQTLFIDARKMGTLIDRVHRELTDADIEKIVSTYHAWRGGEPKTLGSGFDSYVDISGFCKSATKPEIAAHGHILTPGRYVGAEEVEDDGEPFEEKMPRLVAELSAQFAESAKHHVTEAPERGVERQGTPILISPTVIR